MSSRTRTKLAYALISVVLLTVPFLARAELPPPSGKYFDVARGMVVQYESGGGGSLTDLPLDAVPNAWCPGGR